MNDETFLLLTAYRDGELSSTEALGMERRLAAEPELRAVNERLGALSGTLRMVLASPPAPPALHARVAGQFGVASRAQRRLGLPYWQTLAAVFIVGLVGGGLLGGEGTYLRMAPGSDVTMDEVLDVHLRALAAPQPFDIASSNRHVVKPWFNGRTTIAPEAPDLTDQGFPLLGGRIDVVDGKSVPTLVYHHDRHMISVTIVPKTTAAPVGEDHRGGSTIEHWNAGDLTYWAVSDVSEKDLKSFVQLFRSQTTLPG